MDFIEKLKADYGLLFSRTWPVWIGGLMIGVINVFMFSFETPWSTLDGVLNWGDWWQNTLNISPNNALPPLLRSGSVVNIGLLLGAFLSALLAKQFSIRVGPASELIKGLIGGILIGIGAVLARGCNIGAFFSGTSSMGMQGLSMALGLAIGAFIGARFLLWELMRDSGPPKNFMPAALTNIDLGKFVPGVLKKRELQPYFGAVMILGFIAATIAYIMAGYSNRGVILIFGAVLGIVSQRSRFCMVHAFREPFISGDASHTKALLLGLAASVIGFAIIKEGAFGEFDTTFVRSTFWQGSLLGGIIFGFGMVIAGGCGSGMMWRVGEGHVKLWLALVGYVVTATIGDDWLMSSGVINQLGQPVFLPDILGWAWALVAVLGIIVAWYLLAQWNEISHRFAAM
jgi:uncharacterized protein